MIGAQDSVNPPSSPPPAPPPVTSTEGGGGWRPRQHRSHLLRKASSMKPLVSNANPTFPTAQPELSKQSRPSRDRKKAPPKPIKDHQHFKWILAGSFIMCFNSAFINALTLNTFNYAPSAHVTGMVARMSGELISRNWSELQFTAVSYLCFLVGATISGILIQHETFYIGRNYGRSFLLIAAIQCMALVLENTWNNTPFFVWACCLACGLQNGLTSKYSGNVVRTTHLTGTTTDLGIAFGHTIRGRRDEGWRILMHSISITAFFLGGIGGWYGFQRHAHLALLVNISLSALCGIIHTAYISYHENLKILEVLEATSTIKIHRRRVHTRDTSRPYIFEGSSRSGHLVPHHLDRFPSQSRFMSQSMDQRSFISSAPTSQAEQGCSPPSHHHPAAGSPGLPHRNEQKGSESLGSAPPIVELALWSHDSHEKLYDVPVLAGGVEEVEGGIMPGLMVVDGWEYYDEDDESVVLPPEALPDTDEYEEGDVARDSANSGDEDEAEVEMESIVTTRT